MRCTDAVVDGVGGRAGSCARGAPERAFGAAVLMSVSFTPVALVLLGAVDRGRAPGPPRRLGLVLDPSFTIRRYRAGA